MPDGTRWMFFRGGKTIWIGQDDAVSGPVAFPLQSMLIGVDQDQVLYGCGSSQGKAPECMAYRPDAADALWRVRLGEGEKVRGGALAEGMLYVTTDSGFLYAIGD